MPNAEQQMHFLRMPEKSLARELDLEKKLSEARQGGEELKQRLQSAEQETFFLEKEVFDWWERLLEADNSAVVLMSISRELLGRLQLSHFNLNGLSRRESNLRFKLEASLNKLQEKEIASQEPETTLKEVEEKSSLCNLKESTAGVKTRLTEKELEGAEPDAETAEMQSMIDELKQELLGAVKGAETAEAKSKLLEDANKELHEDLCLLRSSGLTPERVQSLEKQLKDSDMLLQPAVVSAEASEEKQSMLYFTISDMESIIEELKRKVSKAESRADSAEDKCIILSESNVELNDELGLLRSRLESLEGSLHHAEETKSATAKTVGVHTKAISNLMKQLAMERERLHSQLTSLAKENRILVVQLQQNGRCSTVIGEHDGQGGQWKISTSCLDFQEPKSSEVCKGQVNYDSIEDDTQLEPADSISQTETVRRIDAGVLSFKSVLIARLIALLVTSAYLYIQHNFLFR